MKKSDPARMKGLRRQAAGGGEFTHEDKIFWPKEKYTKGDIVEYYRSVSRYILPYLKDRPIVLNRHPNGISGKSFFQKDTSDLHLPKFVSTRRVYSKSNREYLRYIVCNNEATLLYLANLGCIEMNPWASRVSRLEKPDFFIADLDPEEVSFSNVILAAKAVHAILEDLGIENYCKTSGKRGLHIYVPLAAKFGHEISRDFGKLLARLLFRALPALMSLEASPKKRRGKIHFDYMRNAKGQTAAAPYSLRPAPGATVSAPLLWKEVHRGLDPKKFTIDTMPDRVRRVGDLWKPVLGRAAPIARAVKLIQDTLTSS